jgi:hypothetical protein
MKRLLQLGLLLVSLNTISAFAGSEQQEIDQYIKAFRNGTWAQQIDICEELQWSGISDTRLFDVIESNLLKLLPTATSDKKAIDIVAWYAKALGMSGNDKYLKTLQKVASAEHKKLKKHGNESIDLVPQYKKWNPIISNSKKFNPGKSLRVNRFSNMLKSDEWQLKLIAAKRMNNEKITDSYLLETLHGEIKKNYKSVSDANLDNLEWMIKILAGLGAPKYQDTLQDIAANAPNDHLRSYTSKILKKNY